MFSMTGFGKGEAEGERWKVSVVIRSLNGKGLDVSVRSPSFLMVLEPKIREKVKESLKRGTVHVFLEAEPKEVIPPVDTEKLRRGAQVIKSIAERDLGLTLSGDKIFELAWKYAERTALEVEEDLEEAVMDALSTALADLLASRRKEGEALKRDIQERVHRIEEILKRIELRKEEIQESIREKVLTRAKDMKLQEEHPTVLNEIMFLLERMDVNEEVARLKAHIDRLREVLSREGEVGKNLEFLAQEMHREITTLGNKMPDLSEFTVAIKVEIDKIRQQAANVE
ncbi:MAG: YicC/YloC family endoribonuclease [Aquificota bacterium]|nr:YicC/YloC family endoribonuclease [Aquificota bacterium]